MTPTPQPEPPDFTQSEDYQKFVESMVPRCRCRSADRPCDGVLAGGICDDRQEDLADLLDDESDPIRETFDM